MPLENLEHKILLLKDGNLRTTKIRAERSEASGVKSEIKDLNQYLESMNHRTEALF